MKDQIDVGDIWQLIADEGINPQQYEWLSVLLEHEGPKPPKNEILKKARNIRGWTQAQAAEMVGYPLKTLQNYERSCDMKTTHGQANFNRAYSDFMGFYELEERVVIGAIRNGEKSDKAA